MLRGCMVGYCDQCGDIEKGLSALKEMCTYVQLLEQGLGGKLGENED